MEAGKNLSESSLVQTTKKFNQNWKTEIDTLNRDCIQSFSNFKCGTRIIQAKISLENSLDIKGFKSYELDLKSPEGGFD